MRKYFVLLMAVVFSAACVAPCAAQEVQEQEQEESWLSGEFSTGYSTAYLIDFGLLCGKDSWVSELLLELPYGIYGGGFYNHGFREFGEEGADWSREFDPTIGIAIEDFLLGLTWDASITYWDCWGVFRNSDNDFWYPALEVGKELEVSESQTLTPAVRVAFPISVAEGGDDGALLFLKLAHGLQVSEKVSVESWFSLVRDDGVIGLQPGWLGEPGVVVSYSLAEHLSINAGVRGILLFSDDMEEKNVREEMAVFSSNLVFEF